MKTIMSIKFIIVECFHKIDHGMFMFSKKIKYEGVKRAFVSIILIELKNNLVCHKNEFFRTHKN